MLREGALLAEVNSAAISCSRLFSAQIESSDFALSPRCRECCNHHQHCRDAGRHSETEVCMERAKGNRSSEAREIRYSAVQTHDRATACWIERAQAHDQHVQPEMIREAP